MFLIGTKLPVSVKKLPVLFASFFLFVYSTIDSR